MNKPGKTFLLLDIDGTMLEDHGYLEAYLDTVNDFLAKMGQPELSVDKKIWASFEAQGIRAEWDMVPLTLAAFLNAYLEAGCHCDVDGTFPPSCSEPFPGGQEAFERMMLDQIADYIAMLDPNQGTMEAVFSACNDGKGKGLPALWKTPLRDVFFGNTLDPWHCPFFAGLMARLLGSENYEAFYEMPAPVKCESYLATRDIPLISEYYRKLLPEIAGQGVYPTVMTYRPTRMPDFVGNKGKSYYVNTPEGECAMQLLGWDDGRVKLLGTGSLCYIEEKYGLRRESLCKPHPFHGIASMLYALTGDEHLALEMAYVFCETNPSLDVNPADGMLDRSEPLKIAVFEDSVTGVECAKNAAELLCAWGFTADAVLCGIRSYPEKDEILMNADCTLYPDVNQALDAVLSDLNLTSEERK